MNKELTKPLYDLMNLLNKQGAETRETCVTIDQFSQKLVDIFIESGIDANVIAAETILNRLIRSVAKPYDRPNFLADELEPYEIYTVQRALKRNKSPMVGLSFEDIKKQFLSDELYTERNGTSYLDPFFKTKVSTDNLIKYANILKERGDKVNESDGFSYS